MGKKGKKRKWEKREKPCKQTPVTFFSTLLDTPRRTPMLTRTSDKELTINNVIFLT
jgi:hypothetical protein